MRRHRDDTRLPWQSIETLAHGAQIRSCVDWPFDREHDPELHSGTARSARYAYGNFTPLRMARDSLRTYGPRMRIPSPTLALVGLVVGSLVLACTPAPPPTAPTVDTAASPRAAQASTAEDQRPPPAPIASPTLEVLRVADDSDALGTLTQGTLPAGLALHTERVSIGRGQFGHVKFVAAKRAPGESYEAMVARMDRWISGLELPKDIRVALGPLEEVDSTKGTTRRDGVRTFLLTGTSTVHVPDVVDAKVVESSEDGVYIVVVLSQDAAERFRIATKEAIGRRIAIVVDGKVTSAPVVRGEISGGRLSIETGDPGTATANANALVKRLLAH